MFIISRPTSVLSCGSNTKKVDLGNKFIPPSKFIGLLIFTVSHLVLNTDKLIGIDSGENVDAGGAKQLLYFVRLHPFFIEMSQL